MQCQAFFDQLWRDYVQITPQAARIHELFRSRVDEIVNDHVALRTFNLSPIDIDSLEGHILALGYRRFEAYHFDEKHLDAWAYLPEDEHQPRIFFSQLLVEKLSSSAQKIIRGLVGQVPDHAARWQQVFFSGALWQLPSWQEYQQLLQESEYAAWLSVMGLRANHFTVSVNHLINPSLQSVVECLQQAGFELNQAGGVIKGNAQALLEQASTLADSMHIEFADGDRHSIKTCYYEFARRYTDANGALYQGFVPASADALFHSTDVR